jgi:Mrp family chromosome partitioning ATPase
VADAAVLSHLSGGAILVAAVGRTTKKQLEIARSALQAAGTKAVGCVLTMVKSTAAAAYIHEYRYSALQERRAAPPRKRPRPGRPDLRNG